MFIFAGEDDERLNGDTREIAFEKYMFTDDDEDGPHPG